MTQRDTSPATPTPSVDVRRSIIRNTENEGTLRYNLGTYKVEPGPDGGRSITLSAVNPADYEWGMVLEVDQNGQPVSMSGSVDLATKVYQGGMIDSLEAPIDRSEGEDRFVIRFRYTFRERPGVDFNDSRFLVDVTGVKKRKDDPFDGLVGDAGLSRNNLEENPMIAQLVLSGIDSLANILYVSSHRETKHASVYDIPHKISTSMQQASTALTMFVGYHEQRKKIHVP